jgi:TonB family protein
MDNYPTPVYHKYKFYGTLATVLFHGGLISYLLLKFFTTPIPPYPEGGGGPGMGIEVNLGYSDVGLGNEQPDEVAMPDFKAESAPAADEQLLTQNVEDAPTVNANAVVKKNNKKVEPTKVTKTTSTTKTTKKTVNSNLLYKKNTGSQGIVSGTGDMGDPGGIPGSNSYTGNGQGSGGGTGGGSGSGIGTGIGPGISVNLNGRTALSLPKPAYTCKEEGKVVVEVTVDKSGKVIAAVAGVRGSTSVDDCLCDLAKKAALQAKFDVKKDAAAIQKGTITYIFKLSGD